MAFPKLVSDMGHLVEYFKEMAKGHFHLPF